MFFSYLRGEQNQLEKVPLRADEEASIEKKQPLDFTIPTVIDVQEEQEKAQFDDLEPIDGESTRL